MAATETTIAAGVPPARHPVAWLVDWITASDPALSRLRTASRALLSLLINGALLAGFFRFVHPLPFGALGLPVVISFVGSTAVRDPGWRAQAITRCWMFLAAVVIVFIASLLAPYPVVADVAFLAVVFGAIYIRTFGLRWTVVGLMGFMAYFMGDYLKPAPADIGWVALAAATAFVVTQLVTTVILPDDAERDFRRALVTVEHRINLILRALLDVRASGRPIDRPPFQEQLARLRDTVLMAEGFIPQGEAGSLAAAGAASDLAIALFELQLITERTVRASYIALPPENLLHAVLARDTAEMRRVAPGSTENPGTEEVTARLLARLGIGLERLETTLGHRPSPAFAARRVPVASAAPAPGAGTGSAPRQPIVPRPLQAPIQVTLACAIAMIGGELLSSSRWYWAVLTAFIVFSNTRSRADTAFRALQRSTGTFVGILGGTVLATLLHDQPVITAVLIPVMFFLGFYFLAMSYSTMIFFVTLALALIFGLMGSFTPELLVVRLEETVLGSAAGAAVAFFVFPAKTSDAIAAVLGKYLDALGDLLRAASGRIHGEPEPQHLLARSRLLDRAYTDLANAVRPLGGPWNAVTRFGEIRERLLLLTGCAHWGRVLARSLRPGQSRSPDEIARLDGLIDEIGQRIDAARAVRETFFDRPDVPAGTVTAATPRPPVAITEEEDPAFALAVMAALLDRATLAPADLRKAASADARVFP